MTVKEILDQIREVLQSLAEDAEYPFSGGVYYGVCNRQTLPEWNYFVFDRESETMTNDHSFTSYYGVHIIREDFIYEDYPLKVIEAMKRAIPGFSVSGDIKYDYFTKGKSELRVEMCSITFKKARKV